MKPLLHLTFLTMIASAFPVSAATLTGLWEFNNSADPAQATVGTDLAFAGAAPGTWSAFLADDGSNSLAGVITTPAAAPENHYIATHNIAANGGGAFVNQYSIVVDLFSPAASRTSWRTILQTSATNSNDGDYFIRPDSDVLGVNALTYSPSPINETLWSRLVVTFDLGSSITTYLDGTPVHAHNPEALDGRFSLGSTVLFFTDEDGENAPFNIGALAVFDGVLTSEEVAALGVAGSAIPESGSATLAMAALLGLARRRRA